MNDDALRCKICQGPIDMYCDLDEDGHCNGDRCMYWEHDAPYPTDYHEAEPEDP